MNAVLSSSPIASADRIRYTNAQEARQLTRISFARFLRLIESLDPEDWSRPTACTDWSVHDMVAHLQAVRS